MRQKVEKRAKTFETFGRLYLLHKFTKMSTGKRPQKINWFYCICECGGTKAARVSDLEHKSVQSCGCLNREKNVIRGRYYLEDKKLHSRWETIRNRTTDRKDYGKRSNYRYYAGKGIKMCAEWRDDFFKFKDWAVANGWHPDLTIDRVDPNSDYSPENCRWITRSENSSRVDHKKK